MLTTGSITRTRAEVGKMRTNRKAHLTKERKRTRALRKLRVFELFNFVVALEVASVRSLAVLIYLYWYQNCTELILIFMTYNFYLRRMSL